MLRLLKDAFKVKEIRSKYFLLYSFFLSSALEHILLFRE